MATKPKGKFRSVRKKNEDDIESSSPNIDTNISKPTSDNTSSNKTIPNTSNNETRDYLGINSNINSQSHQRNPSQSVMVRLKRLDTLRLNQRIKVKDYGYGMIKFLGCVHFAQGLFVGVELDEPNGKHDGSYYNKRYFSAKDKHGVLVKQHRVELLDVNNSNNNSINDNEFNINNIFNNENFIDEISKSNKSSIGSIGNDNNVIINELKMKNKLYNEKLNEYIGSIDELENKLNTLQKENSDLKDEKLQFENEMNSKIEELENELKEIQILLHTKDEVLKKQMGDHDITKNKFRKKIKEHEALKQQNQDTVQLILYGDNLKDEIIAELKKNDKKYNEIKKEYALEMERVDIATQEKLNKSVEEWIFDYGEGGLLIQ